MNIHNTYLLHCLLGLTYYFPYILYACTDVLCSSCPQDPICSLCSNSYYLKSGGSCVRSCPEEYYSVVNGTGLFCNKCPVYCSICSENGILMCTQCTAGKYLENYLCLDQCSWNFYSIATYNFYSCILCDPGCSSCIEQTFCLKCKGNYADSKLGEKTTCTKKCENKFFYEKSTSTCKTCVQNCDNCYDSSKCDRCLDGYSLNQAGLCEIKCLTDSYYNPDLDKCLSCASTISDCVTCSYSYELKKLQCITCLEKRFLYLGKCQSACPDGTLAQSTICVACLNSNCKTCENPPSPRCLSCKNGLYYLDNNCYEKCPEYYMGDNDFTCKKCVQGCRVCNDLISCVYCDLTSALNFNSLLCEATCPSGQYMRDFLIYRNCFNCKVSNCDKCSNGNQVCQSCKQGFFYYLTDQGYCLTDCPDGYFKNIYTKTCDPCKVVDCLSCNRGPSICEKCKASSFLSVNNQLCSKSCDSGSVASNSINICLACASNCESCQATNTNLCLSCISTHFLFNSTCIPTCPNQYFGSGKVCQKCAENCEKCSDSKTCVICTLGTYLFDQSKNCQSKDKTPPGFYAEDKNRSFVPCADSNCIDCRDSPSKCNFCSSKFLLDTQLFNCVGSCGINYFANLTSSTCVLCSTLINQCSICSSPKSCITCSQNYFLTEDSSSCLDKSQAPSGFFPDPSKGKFVPCLVLNCDTCLQDRTICESCKTNFYLNKILDGKCYENCPPYYFNDKSSRLCSLCEGFIPNCLSCESNLKCSKCMNNYYLKLDDQTQCFSPESAPPGFYPDPNTGFFTKCQTENCRICLGTKNSCTECSDGFFFLFDDRSCRSTCPKTYFQEQKAKKCVQCDSLIAFCENCISQKECTQCLEGYFLTIDAYSCLPSNETPSGYFADAKLRKFIPCSVDNCSNCFNDSKVCQSCFKPFYITPKKLKCTTACEVGQYSSSDFTCKLCNQSILNCFQCENSTICTKCDLGYYLTVTNKTCLDKKSSPPGFYPDDTTGRLIPCELEFCSDCKESKELCTKCQENYIYQNENKTCLNSCPAEGHFLDDVNKVCYKCLDKYCDKCRGFEKLGSCKNCVNNLVLSNSSQCLLDCKRGFYLNISYNELGLIKLQSCQECPAECTHCVADGCHSCQEGYSLVNKKCLRICSAGNWLLLENNTCWPCDKGCKTCKGQKMCETCESELFSLKYGECFCEGPGLNFDYKKAICQKCVVEECLRCLRDANLCDECRRGYFLENELKCKPCPTDHCIDCSPSECTVCESGSVLLSVGPNHKKICSLDLECPSGYFMSSEKVCSVCPGTCKLCGAGGVCKDEEVNKNGPLVMKIETLPFSSNIVELKFNKDLGHNDSTKFFNISLADMTPDKYQLDIKQTDNRTIKIEITYKISVVHKTLNITINPNEKVIDENGVGLGNIQNQQGIFLTELYPYTIYTNETKNEVQNMKAAASSTSSSIIFGMWPFQIVKSFSIFWLLIDAMQIANFFLFLNVNYPVNLQTFFEILSNANLEFLQLLFFPVVPHKKKEVGPFGIPIFDQQAPKQFDRRNMTAFFFSNGLVYFIIIPILGVLLLIIRKLSEIDAFKGQIKLIASKFRKVLEYSLVIRAHQIIFLDLCLASFLQIRRFSAENISNVISFILACSVFVYLVAIFFKLWKIVNSRSQFYLSEEYEQKFGLLYEDYKLLSFFHRNYSLLILAKKFLIVFILVFLHDLPFVVLSLLSLLYLLNFIMLARSKPFEKGYFNLLNAVAEFLLLVTLMLIFILVIIDYQNADEIPEDVVETKVRIGWAAAGTCSAVLILYLLSFFFEVAFIMKRILKVLMERIFKKRFRDSDKSIEINSFNTESSGDQDQVSGQTTRVGAKALEKYHTWTRENSLETLNTERDESPKKLHKPDQRSQWSNIKPII